MTVVERAVRGAKNDLRLHALGVFSVAVAFVCLGATLLAVVNVEEVRERWASLGRASVYIKRGASETEVNGIERALRATDGVVSVRRVTSEEARKEVSIAGKDPVLDALPADAFPQSLEVMTRRDVDETRLARIATQLQTLPAVEQVETYGAWSERVGSLLMGGVTASSLLALIVLAAVVSVVASTIRLSLQRRRIEVEILKLVGATDSYVRRPLVLEGAAQGALGSALAIAVLGVLYLIVRSHLDARLVALLGTAPSFLPWPALLLGVLLGTGLGALAAYMSLRRFVAT
ncbi:MAG TPA: permease-like cell division protein FtsX [Polyangiaceae bacterium]